MYGLVVKSFVASQWLELFIHSVRPAWESIRGSSNIRDVETLSSGIYIDPVANSKFAVYVTLLATGTSAIQLAKPYNVSYGRVDRVLTLHTLPPRLFRFRAGN